MNTRKEHDYSTLLAGIDQVIRAELSQMELYCELGRLICSRPEKGAAVAAAAYLAEKYPDQAGFSARNVRRMRDFYRVYENTPELLAQAMHLGWTQNVVIFEADLTIEDRAWYLQAAEQLGWSKLTLQKKIEEGAQLETMVDIDNGETVCYTNGEAEDQPAIPETFGEIPSGSLTGQGADTTAFSEIQSPRIGAHVMCGCPNGMVPFQRKTGFMQCSGDQLKRWTGPVMTGKQRYRLCHTQVGG